MIVSFEHRFAFIKVQKTAGTSVEVFLSQVAGPDAIVTLINPPEAGHEARNFQTALVDDAALRARFVPRIVAEHDKTVAAVLRVLQHDRLLAGDPTPARSIELRNPYVDPISFLQLRLLRAYRAPGERDPRLRDAIRLSINGIAAGLRVTG